MIKISEEEASFKGQLVRELIARVTSDHLIGQKFKNGEMRKKIVEPPWRCPAGFEMEEIHLPLFSMEYLTKTTKRRPCFAAAARRWVCGKDPQYLSELRRIICGGRKGNGRTLYRLPRCTGKSVPGGT